jgi:hypothetical protein
LDDACLIAPTALPYHANCAYSRLNIFEFFFFSELDASLDCCRYHVALCYHSAVIAAVFVKNLKMFDFFFLAYFIMIKDNQNTQPSTKTTDHDDYHRYDYYR